MGHLTYHENLFHDLVQPLNNIYATADYMEPLLDSEVLLAHLRSLKKNATHMLQILYQATEATRTQAETPVSQPLELVSWVTDLVSSCHAYAQANQVHLSFDTNCPRVVVSADPVALERILRNLISNAIKHTPSGTEVLVDIEVGEANHQVVHIHVQDSGPGMSLATASQVFERYHTTSPQQGTGLGLAIAWDLAEEIGIDIGLRNNHQVSGCQFTLEIPVKTESVGED